MVFDSLIAQKGLISLIRRGRLTLYPQSVKILRSFYNVPRGSLRGESQKSLLR